MNCSRVKDITQTLCLWSLKKPKNQVGTLSILDIWELVNLRYLLDTWKVQPPSKSKASMKCVSQGHGAIWELIVNM